MTSNLSFLDAFFLYMAQNYPWMLGGGLIAFLVAFWVLYRTMRWLETLDRR